MKRSLPLAGAGLVLALSFASFDAIPVASHLDPQPVLAQNSPQQALRVELEGDLRTIRRNWRGEEQEHWKSLESSLLRPAPTVQPGDILRYTVRGINRTEQPIGGLVLTDDLPANTVFVLGSAKTTGTAQITYSIDGGATYTATPTIEVTLPDGRVETRPAPADRYTHVRWTFTEPVAAKSSVSGQYQVRVQ